MRFTSGFVATMVVVARKLAVNAAAAEDGLAAVNAANLAVIERSLNDGLHVEDPAAFNDILKRAGVSDNLEARENPCAYFNVNQDNCGKPKPKPKSTSEPLIQGTTDGPAETHVESPPYPGGVAIDDGPPEVKRTAAPEPVDIDLEARENPCAYFNVNQDNCGKPKPKTTAAPEPLIQGTTDGPAQTLVEPPPYPGGVAIDDGPPAVKRGDVPEPAVAPREVDVVPTTLATIVVAEKV